MYLGRGVFDTSILGSWGSRLSARFVPALSSVIPKTHAGQAVIGHRPRVLSAGAPWNLHHTPLEPYTDFGENENMSISGMSKSNVPSWLVFDHREKAMWRVLF